MKSSILDFPFGGFVSVTIDAREEELRISQRTKRSIGA